MLRPACPLLLAAALSATACVGCRDKAANLGPTAADARPPLVLISIDTLRWDHVPAYGYRGVETPAIDSLRRDGILFETAYSHVPLTLPSHASMLTGLLPTEHGVRVNMGYALADRHPFLPQLLREHGYATGAAVSSFVLRGTTGMERGFDLYEDGIDYSSGHGLAGSQRSGGETLERSLAWLSSAAARPFFFFLHLYEPHAPYDPPEPYASRYPLAYDGEIAAADRVVGDLLAELKRLGVYERAAILLTSDHGDALGDHGEQGHGMFLYRSTVQVPLILKLPERRSAGSSVATPAQLADVAPTLLELAGVPARPEMTGRSLLQLAGQPAAARPSYAETYYTRLYFGWSELRAILDGRYAYVDSSEPELYDLTADPGQERNVLGAARQQAAALRAVLAGLPPNFDEPGAFDLESRQKLESLGYVGGARSRYRGALPPPRSQLHTLAMIDRAMAAFAAKRYGKAAEEYRLVVAENPHAIRAWEQLAICLERMGRLSEALAAYREALARSGNEPHLAVATAEILLALGQLAEARQHAELALGWDQAAAREVLARVALAAGDPGEALRQGEAGLAVRRDAPLLVAVARAERQQGNLARALELAREAERLGGRTRGLHLLLGDLLARSGDPAGAEAAFQRESELFPQDHLAPSNLAALYVATGRRDEALAVLREMVERNPAPSIYLAAARALRALGEEGEARGILAEARRRFPRHPDFQGIEGGAGG
jgi:arylsulfatase A-like enzyme/Flp pilus assembly protein TadD